MLGSFKYSGILVSLSRPNPNLVLWALASYAALLVSTVIIL